MILRWPALSCTDSMVLKRRFLGMLPADSEDTADRAFHKTP
jgi:hypothetical protein